jgi:uncharacterized membrane protein
VEDVDPRLSKIILVHAAVGAGLNLADSIRTRGARRSVVLLALGIGLPAVGELLATGPLGLLRHRTRPRKAGVPLAILLGWYAVIHGSFTLAEGVLSRLPLDEDSKRGALPPLAALVGTSLDLVLDSAGLDAGLWEWSGDGTYAPEVVGANGRRGVPLVNFLGWLALVAGAASAYERVYGRERGPEGGRLPVLLLLPYYLAAVAWAVGRRRPKYLLYSLPFPVALYVGLKKG